MEQPINIKEFQKCYEKVARDNIILVLHTFLGSRERKLHQRQEIANASMPPKSLNLPERDLGYALRIYILSNLPPIGE